MKPYSFFKKSSVIISGILICGMALTGCASSGKKCLQWTTVTVGQMPSGVPITENKCAKWESDEAYKKRTEKEKGGY